MTTIPVSVRYDFYKKRLKGEPEPKTDIEKEEQSRRAGRKSAWGWTTKELSMAELAHHVTTGNAISVGLYSDGHRITKTRTGGWVLGLDFEVSEQAQKAGVDPATGLTVEKILNDEFLAPFIGVAAPTSSDKPEAPRSRVLIPLSRSVTPDEYTRIALVFINKYPNLLGIGESRDATRYYYGSTPDPSRVFYNDDAELDVDQFFDDYPVAETEEAYIKSPLAQKRLERHSAQPQTTQEAVVIECVDLILESHTEAWRRDEILSVTMSSYVGSNGSTVIRDYWANHPKAPFNLNGAGADEFIKQWDAFEPREDGYTLSTLFWWARKYGWLQKSEHDIPDVAMTHINVRYVQEWIEEEATIPERCLLMSQTGSGKTFVLKHLYERLGKPKTVVFVPSTKLAMEMAGTLLNEYGLPTTLYINPSNGVIKDTKELVKADILITTLQTFATKVYNKGIPMSQYGLVYIEECDQLFQQFARGGDGAKAHRSHVSQYEAQSGYACIREVFQSAGTVWCVDATMSRVSFEVAESMKGSKSILAVKNDYISAKAPVKMLSTRSDAYEVVLRSLMANLKVVVAYDTQGGAEEMYEVMKKSGVLENKKAICLTAVTAKDTDAVRFMSNVNLYAPQYDLVVYNSVMASGVSITSIKPDVVVQICTYLTPRSNIQMLNRYRKQEVVYCFYRDTESIYTKNALELQTEASLRAWREAGIINLTVAERSDDAELRNKILALSVSDQFQQERSARSFYIGLLKGDGREVSDEYNLSVSARIKQTLMEVRGLVKAEREYVREHWIDVAPIEQDAPDDPSLTKLEKVQGRVHRMLRDLFHGQLPDEEPSIVYDVAGTFKNKARLLDMFINQKDAMEKSGAALLNPEVSVMMLNNDITYIKVLSAIHILYRSLDAEIDDDILATQAHPFVECLRSMSNDYDSIINRVGQKFQEVYDRSNNDQDRALDFAKILLATVGLKQRSVQVSRNNKRCSVNRIENLDKMHQFMKWRGKIGVDTLTIDPLRETIEDRKPYIEIFNSMTSVERDNVISLVCGGNNVDFATAVMLVQDTGERF